MKSCAAARLHRGRRGGLFRLPLPFAFSGPRENKLAPRVKISLRAAAARSCGRRGGVFRLPLLFAFPGHGSLKWPPLVKTGPRAVAARSYDQRGGVYRLPPSCPREFSWPPGVYIGLAGENWPSSSCRLQLWSARRRVSVAAAVCIPRPSSEWSARCLCRRRGLLPGPRRARWRRLSAR